MVWIQTGFAMTILSAAIKAIPDDIVEAAELDGVRACACSATSPSRASVPRCSWSRYDHHDHAQGLRHRADHDGWQLPDQRRGERVLHPELPAVRLRPRRRAGRPALRARHPRRRLPRTPDAESRRRSDEHLEPADRPSNRRSRQKRTAEDNRAGGRSRSAPATPRRRLTSPWASRTAIVIAVLWTIPTFGLLITSIRGQHDINPARADGGPGSPTRRLTLENYRQVLAPGAAPRSGAYFVNTIVITVPAVLIPITLALLAAYAFAWIDVPRPRPAVRRRVRAPDRAPAGHADPAAVDLYVDTLGFAGLVLDGLAVAHDLRAPAGDLPVPQLHEGHPTDRSSRRPGSTAQGTCDLLPGAPAAAHPRRSPRSRSSSSSGSGTTSSWR